MSPAGSRNDPAQVANAPEYGVHDLAVGPGLPGGFTPAVRHRTLPPEVDNYVVHPVLARSVGLVSVRAST